MSFNISWFSCSAINAPMVAADHIIDMYQCKAAFSIGDTPYLGSSNGWGGTAMATIDKDSSVATISTFHADQRSNPAWTKLANNTVLYYMADDHEWGGDNWDHTILQANNAGLNIGASTQAEVDTHFDRCNQAIIAYSTNNPTNSDADAIPEIPSEADETDPDKYPVRYFRVGYDLNGTVDNTTPHVEFFVLDCMSYRSPIADTDNSSKKMMGDNQRGWLTAHLNSSTATFKVIATPKKTYKGAGGDNGDTWGEYTTEREVVMDYIDDNSITGVIWLAGDRHTPTVEALDSPGQAHDHLCVVACPVQVDINTPFLHSIDAQTRYVNQVNKVFGLLTVEQDYIEASICSVKSGSKLWTGRVVAGSNALSYATNTVSAA